MQTSDGRQRVELKGQLQVCFVDNTLPSVRETISEGLRQKLAAFFTKTDGQCSSKLVGLMESNGFRLSDTITRDGFSLNVSFVCFTEESLSSIELLHADEQLDKLFTDMFCPEFVEHGLASLTLRIPDEEFDRCTMVFIRDRALEASLKLSQLPVEILELLLMKTLMKLFVEQYTKQYKSYGVTLQAYRALAAVCYNWWQTMSGWAQSTTRHWFRHKLCRVIDYVCAPYTALPRQQSRLRISGRVRGVAVCNNQLFVIIRKTSTLFVLQPCSNQLKPHIELSGIGDPCDLVACTETNQLYLITHDGCIWRISLDDHSRSVFVPPAIAQHIGLVTSWSLSITSRRLLVTSRSVLSLRWYGHDGTLLKVIPVNGRGGICHALETCHETFLVTTSSQVIEIDVDGKPIRTSCCREMLGRPRHLSVDSDGRVFVADEKKHRILLLNGRLELERVLLDFEQHRLTNWPRRLCYVERTGRLFVGGGWNEYGLVQAFKVR